MKKLMIFLIFIGLTSCGKSSELNKNFNCGTSTYENLEKLRDFKKNFSIELPKNWKSEYIYDNVSSSIISKDTTLDLTKSTFLNASFIVNPVEFDEKFVNIIKLDNQRMELQEVKSNLGEFKEKPMYYNLSKAKKGGFDYHILNVFIKSNGAGFVFVKTEVYGDSLVNERLCKAVNLINRIEFE